MKIKDLAEVISCNNYYIAQDELFQKYINAYDLYYGERHQFFPDYKLFHIYTFAYFDYETKELVWMNDNYIFIGYRLLEKDGYVPFFISVHNYNNKYEVTGFCTFDNQRDYFNNFKDKGLIENKEVIYDNDIYESLQKIK